MMKTPLLLALLWSFTQTFAQTYTVVADSLRLPVGVEFDAQGRLWVVESGFGFNDGAVSIIDGNGNLLPVLVQLPSLYDTVSQETVGPWHTTQLSNHQFALVIGTTGQVLTFDLTGFTPGITPPKTMADQSAAIEVAAYALGNGFHETDPYTVAVDPNGDWFIADAAANAIFKANSAGQLSTVATFPSTPNPIPVGPPVVDAVPTRIIAKPGGGFYVSQLTGFPFIEGSANILTLDASGNVSAHAPGLTTLSDMALDPATGDLYALQLGRFDLSIFNFAPNSCKVIKVAPNGAQTVVAEGLDFGSGIALDAQGNIYVAELATGRVLRAENPSTGTKESIELSISLAPNPATDVVQIGYQLQLASRVSVRVLDAQGKVVFTEYQGDQSSGEHQLVWQPAGLQQGIYWVEVQTDKATYTRRLVWLP